MYFLLNTKPERGRTFCACFCTSGIERAVFLSKAGTALFQAMVVYLKKPFYPQVLHPLSADKTPKSGRLKFSSVASQFWKHAVKLIAVP